MSKTDTSQLTGGEIAIVGMAGRFPGCRDVAEFWRNLESGTECIKRLTDDELRAAGVPASDLADPSYVKAGGVLDGFDMFDAGFFGYSPKDAGIMDPQVRNFLECCWSALEHAGHPPRRFPGPIGVFAGCGMTAYFTYNILSNPDLVESVGLFLLRHTGNDRDFMPTTVSYKLNLRGPSIAIQTACSTSLVAIHMAGQSLQTGECDMALAGGVTIMVPHGHGYHYRENEIQSPDGHCYAFDSRAAGTVLTSGAGVVALRRLADAIEDGDFIHAVIRGTAVNNDGSGKVGYLAPSVDGHAAVVTEALAVAGLTPDDISYIETHGTGTLVGDPIEVAALTQAFRKGTQRRGFCRIGSVKASIGHTDTAAGVAGIIKLAESLKHRKIPPSLNFRSPNPSADFEGGPFVVNDRLVDWVSDGPRRAGLSSLGVGGTNAHAVLEEAPAVEPSDAPRPWEVLVLSAKTAPALDRGTADLAQHLHENPELNLGDVAHTLQIGRDTFEHRRIVACCSLADAAKDLEAKDAKRVFTAVAPRAESSVVFMFPGGGAQYPDMAREVYEREPAYRAALDDCLRILRPHLGLDLRRLMLPELDDDRAEAGRALESPLASVCAVFAVEYAMAKLWLSWGIEPAAMTGHSLGEYCAACLAGVMSLEDALKIVALRGQILERVPDAAMLSIPLPEERVRGLLDGDLDLAAINAPSMCVVSGRNERLAEIEHAMAGEEVECRRLRISTASHSRLLEPVLGEFRAGIAALRLGPPQLPYVSNVTGTWVKPEDAQSPDYWVRHFRSTVRFSQGLSELLSDPGRVLLEVGPGQTLSSLARQQSSKAAAVLSSVRHPDDATPDMRFLLTNVGRLWAAGYPVDWSRLRAPNERRLRVPLPTYPFERQRYWIEPGRASETRAAKPPSLQRAELDKWFYKPVWRRRDLSAAVVGERKSEGPVLVFLDSGGLGTEIAAQLRRQGRDVVTVKEGDAFYKLNDGEFALAPEGGRAGYDQLVGELAASGRLPRDIVHLWLVTTDEKFRPGSSFFHRNLERGFYSMLFLLQALGSQEMSGPTQIAVLSSGMQSVAGEPLPYPEKATVLGPVRVAPREFPGLSCRSIDIAIPQFRRSRKSKAGAWGTVAQRILTELEAAGESQVVAHRDDGRWELHWEHSPIAVSRSNGLDPPPRQFRDGGVYLITGGLGGIGLATAEHLGRTCRAKLLLIGRSGLPDRSEWDAWLATHAERDATSRKIRRLKDIESSGARVLVAGADVANIEAMQAAIAAAKAYLGPINGVIHAAGAIEDGLISTKTPESVERIFTPKIHGTLLLADLVKDEPLDFFVVFSSTSSMLGPAGQVDYVAANSFLDSFARSGTHLPKATTVAVNWGVWNDVGMATGISRRLKGLHGETPPGGAAAARTRASHPLLGERVVDSPDEIVFSCRYSTREHWVLSEHRTRAGQALIPGTGYLEIARAAAEDVAQAKAVEIRDLSFVSPLAVADGVEREVRISVDREGDRYSLEISSRSGDGSSERWDLHAQGSIKAVDAPQLPRLPITEIAARCEHRFVAEDGDSLRTKQEDFITFGQRWRSIKEIRFGRNEALSRLELPARFSSDLANYKLHPAVLDMATGYCLPLVEGYDGNEHLYVPLAYRRVRVRAPLTQTVYSYARSDPSNHADHDVATFDITIVDEQGNVLVEVEQFTVRRIASAADFAPSVARSGPAERGEEHGSSHQAGGTNLSAGEKLFLEVFEAGITVPEGMAALTRIIGAGAGGAAGVGGAQVVVNPVDLMALIERTGAVAAPAAADGVKFARPVLQSTFEGPRDEIERTLAGYWQDLLGVDQVGINDNFFELGGHSLIAVRLFARVKKAFGIEFPLSTLFEAPTIAKCAELLRAQQAGDGALSGDAGSAAAAGKPRFRFLVPMNSVENRTKAPFFLVAGMFGNVLNLRHLAAHLGDDQAVYAVQARGLYGDDKPHERFEDMATDYLKEIRQVQPHGPYFLGGFSGGGITAYEMARQLRAAGERTGLVVMLDTWPSEMPELTRAERLRIKGIMVRREGLKFITRWARGKIRYERARLRKKLGAVPPQLSPAEFRSEEIKNAFYRAVGAYRTPEYAGDIALFRPALDERYTLGRGRIANYRPQLTDHHNFWRPFAKGTMEVHAVSGDHDAMVLEPHVRVLAQKLRACLARAQQAQWSTAPA